MNLEKRVGDNSQQIQHMGVMIGDQAEKIERVSKKLQGEVIEVISQVGDQKTQVDQWQKIVGDELHTHHQRLSHLEQAIQKIPSSAPDFSPPSHPPPGEGLDHMQKKMMEQECLVTNKLAEVYARQRHAERKAEEEQEHRKKVEKKIADLESSILASAAPSLRSEVNMERVSRVEVMTIDTHHLTQTHEHILREVDYRIGAVEKKLGNWVPPEVYHTDISNLVARLSPANWTR